MTEAQIDYPKPENYRAFYELVLSDNTQWYELDFARLVGENPDLALECCDLRIRKCPVPMTEPTSELVKSLEQLAADLNLDKPTFRPTLPEALVQGLVKPMSEDMYNDLLHSWHFWDKAQAMSGDTNFRLGGHGPYHATERRLVANLKKYVTVFERLLERFPEEAWRGTVVAPAHQPEPEPIVVG